MPRRGHQDLICEGCSSNFFSNGRPKNAHTHIVVIGGDGCNDGDASSGDDDGAGGDDDGSGLAMAVAAMTMAMTVAAITAMLAAATAVACMCCSRRFQNVDVVVAC